MKLLNPLLIALSLCAILLSCKQTENKQPGQSDVIEEAGDLNKVPQHKINSVYQTRSGKSFQLIINKNERSLNDIIIVPTDFENSTDSLIINDADPVSQAFIADLNGDGFDEFYVITTSTGSGSYSSIQGIASNSDKSATPVYVPEISEQDLADSLKFQGYMGHDSIYLQEGFIARKFPVYKEGDANCCPTGGYKTLRHSLVAGEASWILTLN